MSCSNKLPRRAAATDDCDGLLRQITPISRPDRPLPPTAPTNCLDGLLRLMVLTRCRAKLL